MRLPQDLVDVMADDVALEMGWGRLLFGQTFADPEKLAEVLRQESLGRRDICIYAREPHVLVSMAPAELFIDPSHTYRLRFSDDDGPDPSPTGFSVRALASADEADEMNRVYVRCGMVPAPVDVLWDNHTGNESVDYLVAVRDDDGSLLGTVTGVDHERLFSDPENGSSLWTLAVDPTTSLPGVGAALTRALADAVPRPGPGLHGSVGDARQYRSHLAVREAGFRTRPGDGGQAQERDQRTAVHPSAGNRRGPQPVCADHRRRGHAARYLGRGARRRGRRDAPVARRSQRHHPRVVVGVHLRGGDGRCDDKRLTRRLVSEAGIAVPKGRLATFDEHDHAFLEEVGDVVVKPTRGEQGKGITVGVSGPEELDAALVRAREEHPNVLIEQRAAGDDLRLVVIDGKVVAAALRQPAEILGTGHHTVRELIEAQSRRREAATGGESRIPIDGVTEATVKEAGWSFEDVLPEGQLLRVRRTANLHQGGTIHDVTAKVNPHLCEVAVQAADAIGIPVTGVDLLVPDVTARTMSSSRPTSGPGWPTMSRSPPQRLSSTSCSRAVPLCRRRGRRKRRRLTFPDVYQVLVRITISAASCAVDSWALRLPSRSTSRKSP